MSVIMLAWWSVKRFWFTEVPKSQQMLSGITLDIPATKWLWKMCYTAQTQDSDINIFGQFLKSNPCFMPSDIHDFSKICFPFFFFKFSEWVCNSMLLHLYLGATPLQCTLPRTSVAFEASLIMCFSILIKSTGTKLKETREGMGFSGSHRVKQ